MLTAQRLDNAGDGVFFGFGAQAKQFRAVFVGLDGAHGHLRQGVEHDLRAIIDRVKLSDKVGVCLDTCHVFDAGYDIVNDLDGVLKNFDEIIGMKRLKAVHLNDGKNPLGSHKDRHEKLGRGHIGAPALKRLINHPLLKDLPFYLETPNELDGYAREIALLKSWRK